MSANIITLTDATFDETIGTPTWPRPRSTA